MKRNTLGIRVLLLVLFTLMEGFTVVLQAQTYSLSEAVEKADYYLAHSLSERKEEFRARTEQARAVLQGGNTQAYQAAADELVKHMQAYVLEAEPTDGIAFDMTFLLRNAALDKSSDGWSVTPTINYDEAEFWNQTFDFYQLVSGVRPGMYRLNVTGFHRNGDYNQDIVNEAVTDCVIYGNGTELPMQSLYYTSDAVQFWNGTGGYANSMAEAKMIFDKGYYTDNTLLFQQDETGEMTVGIRNRNARYSNWTCFRNFTLEYLGQPGDMRLAGAFRLVSPSYRGGGAVVPGEEVKENTPLYHTSELSTLGKGNYWYVYEKEKGLYALKNVATEQWITYDGQRTDGDFVRRYVTLTDEWRGDSSLWTLKWESDGALVVRSMKIPEHLFDLRVNSWIVGTFDNSGSPSVNQKFALYNAFGEVITDLSGAAFRKGLVALKINGRTAVYDHSNEIFLYSIPDADMLENRFEAELDYTLATGYEILTVDGVPVKAGEKHVFTDVDYGRNITLELVQADGGTCEGKLTFTSLPIVHINGSFSSEYSQATIRVDDPDAVGADTLIRSRIRWRGATTRYRNKKQYAVKLYDPDGVSTDVSFFGLRSDNNWILDGLVIDKARMRNRVVTDLWNDFAVKPYYFDKEPDAYTGTRGHFVELMLNGQYAGIYCMTEKLDRKQMKLKKYDEKKAGTDEAIRGELYKASDWSYSVFMGHYSDQNYYPQAHPTGYSNRSETWDSYEVKYPDLGDGQPVDWAELYDAVDFVCTASDEAFVAGVGKYFDMPTIIDYYILMETILSADNHGKNMYWGVYNRNKSPMLTPALWDLDSTCGRRWDASVVRANQDYTTYITQHEHGDFNLFRRIKACNVDNFNEAVRYRYKELRQGALHTDSILARFYAYKEQFDRSGASAREERRWTNTDIGVIDFDDEMDYLTQWFNTRMDFLDEAWDIASLPDPIPDGMASVESDATGGLTAYSEAGGLVVEALVPQTVTVCTTGGRVLRRERVEAGKTHLGRMPKGIYLVNRVKVAVH